MTNQYLIHYGIKGMRWGIRKKYKDASDKTRAKRDKSSSRFQKKADKYQSEILKLDDSWRNRGTKRTLTKKRDKALKNRDRKLQGKLSTGQRNAALIGVALAAYGTYKLADSGNLTRLAAKGKEALFGGSTAWAKDAKLASYDNIDDIKKHVVSRINPNYGDIGTKMNCRRCTIAYELSRRGYDVQATRSVGATGQSAMGLHNALSPKQDKTNRFKYVVDVFKQTYEGGPVKDSLVSERGTSNVPGGPHAAREIFENLAKKPSKSRGELTTYWKSGGAHSMAWEILNGKPVVIDNQTGTVYDSAKALSAIADRVESADILRLDDKILNDDFLLRWIKNA